MRDAVEVELQRMEREGIIEPIEHSDWASPVVCVPKEDGTIRLCGDYKRMLNSNCCTSIVMYTAWSFQ